LAVVHVRLADIWNSEAWSEMRQLLLKAGPQALQAFNQRFVPAPSSLDRLTVVVLLLSEKAPPAIAVYLTTSSPFDPERLMKGSLRGARAENIGTATYHVDEKAGVALQIVDPHTILVGLPESVRAILGKPRRTGGPLEGTLTLATPTTPIVLGVNVAALPPIPPQQIPPPFASLLKAELFTMSVDVGKHPRFNLSLRFPDPQAAQEGEKAVRAGIAMARMALPLARAQFETMVVGKDKNSPGTLSELPEAVGGLYGLAMIKAYEELLKDFPLELRGSTLQASVPLPAGFSVSNPATAGVAIALLLPAVQKVREAANRTKDANNLKHIALAMHTYHDRFGHLPAAAICSKDGKPLLSWRVALLPYLGEDNLVKQFRLDEPWDSPHNKALLPKMPKVYELPVKESTSLTYYRVFVGPEAGFDLQKNRRFADITDGLSNTWMVVEAAEAVPWTKPDELSYDSKAALPKLGDYVSGGFNVAFMDGSVRFFPRAPDEQTMRALITPAGDEVVRLDK
jgi:prepilin-type processing-associated H-X9-DG protein